MKKRVAAALVSLLAPAVLADQTPAPEGAAAYFVNLSDGDVVSNPVSIVSGLRGLGVAPADIPDIPNTGRHHLLINATLEGEALTQPIPADDNHRHSGAGQTEATLQPPAGTHTLQLVLGDWTHIPHDPPVVSEVITITVP
jgi:hypothetical protein